MHDSQAQEAKTMPLPSKPTGPPGAGLTDRAQARANASARLGGKLREGATPAASAVPSLMRGLREKVMRLGLDVVVSGLTGRQAAADARPPPPLADAPHPASCACTTCRSRPPRPYISAPPPRRRTAMPASRLGAAPTNTALVAGAAPRVAQSGVPVYARAFWRRQPAQPQPVTAPAAVPAAAAAAAPALK